ncbi:MAG: hypothetical protein E6J69_14520 [Deltaproteobacteria bacterium]|nr:MAG: hypothetical protein E6J69_14520 [Deltaproteobacteria bacterium]
MSRMRTFMYAAALAIGVVVLASRGSRAASAVTTTTTLPPPAPAYSLATGACIKEAAAQQKMCNMVASIVACQAEYDTAFSNCFAVGKGVSCAAACVAKNAKCTASATSTTVKPCTKSCQNDWVVAGGQCGGDHACLTAAKGDYKTCKDACNTAALKCRDAFAACLARCPNLGDGTTTTTLVRPATTTTTTTTLPPRPTTTTTTRPPRSTTTTTTKQAAAAQKTCKKIGTAADCQAAYDADFASCFAPGKGVTCAAACVAKKAKCTGSTASSGNTQCTKTCQNDWVAAGSQCGGIQSCYAAAVDAYNACKTACTANPTVVSCSASFAACLAKCPNL